MASYKVINQKVEINGVTREVGAVLDESEFKPASGNKHQIFNEKGVRTGEEFELSELESLLKTDHIEKVN